jgi:SAM-dependent methyltransferase
MMPTDHLIEKVRDYYSARLREHGAVARGVDWNSVESQRLRFDQLLRICDANVPLTINDIGCGYGALLGVLIERGQEFEYRGFDIAPAMVEAAREKWGCDRRWSFTCDVGALAVADYAIASGIFNVKLDTPDDVWQDYVLGQLDTLDRISSGGFAFNTLTSYSDAERMRPTLYYPRPGFLFDYCIGHFSRHVALLHDYGLYECTVLVRKHAAKRS